MGHPDAASRAPGVTEWVISKPHQLSKPAAKSECGLGSTMTAQDVLDGYMIVQVTLQMIRPAEFIELTFKQKMEGTS
jgi:phage tail sheath protein FI